MLSQLYDRQSVTDSWGVTYVAFVLRNWLMDA